MKPRLCRSSWRAFASTYPLTLPSTSPREAFLACPAFPPWNFPSLLWISPSPFYTLALISLVLAKVRLSLTLALSPLTIWCFGLTALFLFLLAKAAPAFLLTALSLWHRGHSFLLSRPSIENLSCSASGHSSQDTSHLILHCPATDFLRRSLFGDSLFLFLQSPVQALWSCPAFGAPWSSAMPPSLGMGR